MATTTQSKIRAISKYSGKSYEGILDIADYGNHLAVTMPTVQYGNSGNDTGIRNEIVTIRGKLLPIYRHLFANKLHSIAISTIVGDITVDVQDELLCKFEYVI